MGKKNNGYKVNTVIDSSHISKPLWHPPRHKIVAILVSQAIYQMRIEAQADRAMIDAYSK